MSHAVYPELVHAVHPELVEGAGDVPVTYADTTALEEDFGFKPDTTLRQGLRKFAEWYVSEKNPLECKLSINLR